MTRSRPAFTLLEIIVVLAILGMGLGIVTSMTTHSARYSARIEEETNVQLACENMMNSILAGNTYATLGTEIPIPDAPQWSATVELLDGPIDKLVAVRITAQRYDTLQTLAIDNPDSMTIARTPDPGRRIVLKEWALRSEVKTRVVRSDAAGQTVAVDGTGDTIAADLAPDAGFGGSLGFTPQEDSQADGMPSFDSAFNALDSVNFPQNTQNPPQTPQASPGGSLIGSPF